MASPTSVYPTPVIGEQPPTTGLVFPPNGTGLAFDVRYPPAFPPEQPGDLSSLFPTIIPAVEQVIYEHVSDAASTRTIFPDSGVGIPMPAVFNLPPDLSVFKDRDGTYLIPVGKLAGEPIPEIPVTRGWPAYPGTVPAIGVAESTSDDDAADDTIQGGFAGDVYAYDALGNVLATAAYYAEPLTINVVVELIHENRDERDRLHDQLRRVLFPLKHLFPSESEQIRGVRISGEKQDLPQDELPRPIYVSIYTVTVSAEALIPTVITPLGTITQIVTTVIPTPTS